MKENEPFISLSFFFGQEFSVERSFIATFLPVVTWILFWLTTTTLIADFLPLP